MLTEKDLLKLSELSRSGFNNDYQQINFRSEWRVMQASPE
jgi:hypothetical protein